MKVKVFPVRSNIMDITKLFIEERNMYSQYSIDYWSKIRNSIEKGGADEELRPGRAYPAS